MTNLFKDHMSSSGRVVVRSWLDEFLSHFRESSSSVAGSDLPHIAVLGNMADKAKRMVCME